MEQRERVLSADLTTLFEPYVWAWFEDAFEQPSPPQVASWPSIAQGKNTLIFSPTGSGKTLAAFLWCINELYRMASRQALEDSVYVLYVSPLKALNNDIQRNLIDPLLGIQAHAQRAGIDVPQVRSAVRTGDTTQRQRAAMARRPFMSSFGTNASSSPAICSVWSICVEAEDSTTEVSISTSRLRALRSKSSFG